LWISELFPELGKHADELCLVARHVHRRAGAPAGDDRLHTGSFQFVRPSLGAWTLYGWARPTRTCRAS
jgi:hypothetical protein